MPTTTETKKKAPATATSSADIAAQIDDTQKVIARIKEEQDALLNQERRAEAELSQQQIALTQAREQETAKAREAELSEDLKALKAKAQTLNEASAALAELWPEFKADYQRHINNLPLAEQQQFYGLGGRSFSPSALPFVAMEEGKSTIKVTTLGSAQR